jgi:hypothetical protein
MLRRVASSLTVALAVLGCMGETAAAPARDGAVIVDSGSTNTSGYRIEIWSDGSASIVLQKRGVTQGAPKAFAVTAGVAAQFFANLKAVRGANVNTLPCMKSASFGTTTRVSWHGWTSPDLDCPSDRAVLNALIASVNKIRAASGIGTLPGLGHGAGGGPLHAETPEPSASP